MEVKVFWGGLGLLMLGILRQGGTKRAPEPVWTKKITQARVEALWAAKGQKLPLTKPSKTFPQGQTSTAGKVLRDSKDPALILLADYQSHDKILSTYIPRYVAKGVDRPITADWNVLVESFRISCAKPNLTNPPRAGDVRGCFKARWRKLYVSADLDQAELRSWSEVCLKMFGYSTMADAFLKGIDPHLKMGAELLGIPLDEAIDRYSKGDKKVEDARQFAKEPDFGLIGGMGVDKFIERAALKGFFLSKDEAKRTIETWKRTWPEARAYLQYFENHYSKPGLIVHPITGFLRGGCGYSDGANHLFQHLTAISVKQALWDVSKECYTDTKSILYGARPIIDMHDELFGEVDEEKGHLSAKRWGQVMRAGVEKWIKHVPVKCTPVLTRRLHKGAKPVFVDDPSVEGGKRLVPSKPLVIDGKTKWIEDKGEV
jgi:DNA polymerase I-like protein with 3'-5' exonuclease and polymerase domains